MGGHWRHFSHSRNLISSSFFFFFAGFRFDGDYVNRICHISSTNYRAQWRRIGPPRRGVKYVYPLRNKIVSFGLINSQQLCGLIFTPVLTWARSRLRFQDRARLFYAADAQIPAFGSLRVSQLFENDETFGKFRPKKA